MHIIVFQFSTVLDQSRLIPLAVVLVLSTSLEFSYVLKYKVGGKSRLK